MQIALGTSPVPPVVGKGSQIGGITAADKELKLQAGGALLARTPTGGYASVDDALQAATWATRGDLPAAVLYAQQGEYFLRQVEVQMKSDQPQTRPYAIGMNGEKALKFAGGLGIVAVVDGSIVIRDTDA